MSEIADTVLPIFALIALGFLVGRLGLIGEDTSKGLAAFTFTLAIPAMMFRAIATADLPDVSPLAVWIAYFGTVVAVWLTATLATRVVLARPDADGASIAMSSSFGNIVMVGIPLAISAFGPEAAGPIALIIAVHSPLLWLLASLHLGIVDASGRRSAAATLKAVLLELAKNPMIVAILAGSAWRFTGLGLEPTLDRTIALLGAAAPPCALVSLGLSLVGRRITSQLPTLSTILILKLALMPALAWLLAVKVLELPAIVAGVVVLFAAMPTGANAYLFARQHGRAVNSASAAVALGTAFALATASLALAVLALPAP